MPGELRPAGFRLHLVCCLLGVACCLGWARQALFAENPTLVFPDKDPELQDLLERGLADSPFNRLIARHQLSVCLVDLCQSPRMRYAGIEDDRMRYAASLPKVAILLSVFDQIERGRLAYTPALRAKLERMIRRSSNPDSTDLIRVTGFEAIANVLSDPRYRLYDRERGGGLWVGRDYGGFLGLWKRDPLHSISHGATARQVARFFVMLDSAMLVSPWASSEMKQILSRSEINHKFVRGLKKRPGSQIYRKSGTWERWHADAALVERTPKKYVAVALMESPPAEDVFSKLILKLDDMVGSPTTGEH